MTDSDIEFIANKLDVTFLQAQEYVNILCKSNDRKLSVVKVVEILQNLRFLLKSLLESC